MRKTRYCTSANTGRNNSPNDFGPRESGAASADDQWSGTSSGSKGQLTAASPNIRTRIHGADRSLSRNFCITISGGVRPGRQTPNATARSRYWPV